MIKSYLEIQCISWESVILLLLIVLLVSVCKSFNVTTVSSIECVTVSSVMLVVIPVPPLNCKVSVPRAELYLFLYQMIAIRSVGDVLDVVAFVTRPFESTLITGIAVIVHNLQL